MTEKIRDFRDLDILKIRYINDENKKDILEKIKHESRMFTNLIKKII